MTSHQTMLEFVARRLCAALDGDPDRHVLPKNFVAEITRSGCSVVRQNFLVKNYVTWLEIANEAIFALEEWYEAQANARSTDRTASLSRAEDGEESAEAE